MGAEFEIKGQWWTPSSPEYRVHGTLTFHPTKGSRLEVFGNVSPSKSPHPFNFKFENHVLILGLSSDSKLVTLYKCWQQNVGGGTLVSNQESGIPPITYIVHYVLVGIHALAEKDLAFDTIVVEPFNLGEWVGISGFQPYESFEEQRKNFEEKRIKVNYKVPDSILFPIDDTTEGSIEFSANHPGGSIYQKSIQINQTVRFQAKSSEPKPMKDLLDYYFVFQDFLILALYRNTYPMSIVIHGSNFQDDLNGHYIRKPVDVFFSIWSYQENEEPNLAFDMIFSYPIIKSDFKNLIKKWYSKYERLAPSINLLMEQFHQRNKFNSNVFLNIAQAIETFHARTHDHSRIPKKDYEVMKKDMLNSIDEKYHDWLNNQFSFGNHLTLHERLVEMIDKFSNKILDKVLGDKDRFVKQVKHSRNYYTHYSNGKKKYVLEGSELFHLSERMKFLLISAFLMEIGFSKDLVTKCLDNSRGLFNHLIRKTP
ncbi:MAG: hypothetical protein R2813_10845 [Flavobacteriales bacterium]